jgi:hypothetical protein
LVGHELSKSQLREQRGEYTNSDSDGAHHTFHSLLSCGGSVSMNL